MDMVSRLAIIPFQLGSRILSDLTTLIFVLALGGGAIILMSTLVVAGESPIAGSQKHLELDRLVSVSESLSHIRGGMILSSLKSNRISN